MLNNALDGKRYFCGMQISGYDLQVYCEMKSMIIFAEETFTKELEKQTNILDWMKRIDIIPEVAAQDRAFRASALELLEGGLSRS